MIKMAKILVVDDEENIRFLICTVLQKSHTVLEASDGQEGWRLFQIHHPQLVITDLSMPNMSGFELIRNIWGERSKSKIIATSALFHRREERDLVMKAGATVCLPKPVELPTLEKAVVDLLGL